MARGRFIVLEGIDGCGKSTQAHRLTERLREAGRDPLHVREPGSTALGEALRSLLLARAELALVPAAEALLFVAARRQMLDERVEPALAAGRDVVCERFHASTFAYQGAAGGVDEGALLALFAAWAGSPAPDLVVVLDVPPELAAERARVEGRGTDRFEARGIEFQRRVAAGMRRYAELVGTPEGRAASRRDGARARPGRVAWIDATASADEVAARVEREVARAR